MPNTCIRNAGADAGLSGTSTPDTAPTPPASPTCDVPKPCPDERDLTGVLPVDLGSTQMQGKSIEDVFNTMYALVVDKAKIELDAGRIVDSQYATILASSISELIKQSINFQLASDKSAIENEIKQDQWLIQRDVLMAQRDMVIIDRNTKKTMVGLDMKQKTSQINQIEADVAFTTAKQLTMEYTRLDNIRIKAASEFADFLKYLTAADLVASKVDFTNIRCLIQNITEAVNDPLIPGVSINNTAADEDDYVKPAGVQ